MEELGFKPRLYGFALGKTNSFTLSMEYLRLIVRGLRNAQVAYGMVMLTEAASQM